MKTKKIVELLRFPINEKYGELTRFKTLMKTLPLKYEKIFSEDIANLTTRQTLKLFLKKI